MKIYMDDARETPSGWTRTYTVAETIAALRTRTVTHLSLDNDLGDDVAEGYNVLNWLEEIIYNDMHFPLPEIHIHSSNASRVEYMQRALKSIQRIRQQQVGGS